MRSGRTRPAGAGRLALLLSLTGALGLAGPSAAEAQEPGFFGKLFRQGFGQGQGKVFEAPPPPPIPASALPAAGVPEVRPLPGPAAPVFDGRPVAPPTTPLEAAPGQVWEQPGGPASSPPRLVPQPRVSRAATEADPIVSRVTLGRSDDGRTFGMFLQVFADGTVIDSEGVHPVGRDGIRGVLEALQAGELFRVRGHCGGPPTDFLEQAHVTVYERSLGRLRANAFSFSGNPQGCDPSVVRLQQALDALQARLGSAAGAVADAPPAAVAPAVPPDPAVGSAPLPPPIRLNEGP